MGWSGGTDIAQAVIKAIKPRVKDAKTRTKIYKDIIDALESADWDNQDEVIGLDDAFDKALE